MREMACFGVIATPFSNILLTLAPRIPPCILSLMKHAHPHCKLTHSDLVLVGCCIIALLAQIRSCSPPCRAPYSKDDIEKIQATEIYTAAKEPLENITTEPVSPHLTTMKMQTHQPPHSQLNILPCSLALTCSPPTPHS